MRQLDDDGKAYTEDYKILEKKSQEVNGKYKNYEKEYIRSNPTIVGLYLLKQQIRRMHDTEEASDIMHIYKTGYAGKFADNPMTGLYETLDCKPGNKAGWQVYRLYSS